MTHVLDPLVNRLLNTFDDYVKELESCFELLKSAYRYGYVQGGGVLTWYGKIMEIGEKSLELSNRINKAIGTDLRMLRTCNKINMIMIETMSITSQYRRLVM